MGARTSASLVFLMSLASFVAGALAGDKEPAKVNVTANIIYKTGTVPDSYEAGQCQLDLYVPVGARNLPCLVWFHGGGLTEGSKSSPATQATCRALAEEGIVVASATYRFSPRVKFPDYVGDAAAAVAWMQGHAAEHGGDPGRVFVGGHSAGGYLAAMLGLDARYLQAAGVDGAKLAGFIPVSAQMMTHFTVRQERGLPKDALVADAAAPMNHVRGNTPPWLVLYAEHDMALRGAENRFFAEAMRQAGQRNFVLSEIAGRDHATIADRIAEPNDPARKQIADFTRSRER